MLLAPFLLFCALPQDQDAAELTRRGLAELRRVEAEVAAGRLTGLDVPDAFFGAALALRKACEAGGAPPEAFAGWSEALLNADDLKKALAAVEQGLAEHPGSLPLLLQHGRVLGAMAGRAGGEEQQRLYRQARDAYAEAARRHPKSAVACVRRGEMEVYLGDLEAAAKAWQEALRRDPDQVDLGAMAAWLPQPQAAQLIDGLLAQPGADRALLTWYRGLAAYNSLLRDPKPEYWQACREDFERALELNPGYDTSWYYLANAANVWAGRLNAEDPAAAGRIWAYAARAWGRYLAGNGGNAQRQALAGMGEGAAAFLDQLKWFAGKAWGARDPESAIAIARWVAESSPSDPEAWNNLALFLRDTGRAEESLRAYEKALELQPDHPQVMNDLAVILHYYLKRDDDRARDLYQRAIARAEEMLAGDLSEEERGLIEVALRDARNNLAKLDKGDRENG